MKTFLFFAALLLITISGFSQTVVKLYHDDTMKDSITYQNSTSILVINRADLESYMHGMDTTLEMNCYNNKVFRNIQFAHVDPKELENHFKQAKAYLADSTHSDMHFSTDKITLFWAPNEGILLPYIEDMLTQVLEDGRIAVTDKTTHQRVPQYTIFYEDVDGQSFKIYKLPSGKIIFRESNYYLEQFVRTTKN
jgi:E3 ubiquitin-protein ligase DOA10